jgi:hypothetical protein
VKQNFCTTLAKRDKTKQQQKQQKEEFIKTVAF